MIAVALTDLVMSEAMNGALSFSPRALSCKQSSGMTIFLSGSDACLNLRTVPFSL
jgi:hypothetical protein